MRTIGLRHALQYLSALAALQFSIENLRANEQLRPFRSGTPARSHRKRRFYEPEAGRLTRKARRGHLIGPTPIQGNPDRYLNSHARNMKALVEALAHRQPSALA